jgi:SAM-dependent methyltransferase
VEGLELNEKAAESARSRGFTVHTCLIEALDPESYDVVVLSNVLEHSLDPRQMLMDIRRVLSPKGQIWISCPNSRSWMRSLYGRSWINWHVPVHISFFSPEAMKHLLAEVGFSNIRVQQISPALWVSQSIIAALFGKRRKKNRQLRNPFLTIFLLLFTRTFFFPALWLGNLLGRGDCLLVVATKG